MTEKVSRKATFGFALTNILLLATILIFGLAYFKIHVVSVFIIAIFIVALLSFLNGIKVLELQKYFLDGTKKSVLIILILMSVGMVIGTWIVSGIVPSIIYYGLQVLSPTYFLITGFIICCIVTSFTGSSYATIGTLGIAFIGIGYGMGIPAAPIAGMVISGAIFGDKMTPLSDTTNLASGVAGVNIFSHIRSMLYTTIPAVVICAVLYWLLGLRYSGNGEVSNVNLLSETLMEHFTINPVLLLVPLLTIFLVFKKIPPIIALNIGAFSGIITAFIFQSSFSTMVILNSLSKGFVYQTGVADVDNLLQRGGISGMLTTITLVVLVFSLGEMLQRTGIVSVILEKLKYAVTTPAKLVLTTIFSCFITNMLSASQYLAIMIPGEMLRPAYEKLKISKRVLSRTLEDAGTITTFVIPWSSGAIFAAGVLDVATLEYLPFAFFAILSPLIAAIYAIIGFAIFKEDKDEENNISNNEFLDVVGK
jgi:NhaC family Na+:H+ antiporter